jgi:DNA-directed RNA polymerase, mitochondrial
LNTKQQLIDDASRQGIALLDYMEYKFGAYLGRKVFSSCQLAMSRSMKLLKIFEEAGTKAEQEQRFLSWVVPVTEFPVVQNYTNGRVKKIYIQWGPPEGPKLKTGHYRNTLQLNISFPEEPILAKRKQAQGASPNIIHSLDAAHLMLTIHRAQFPVTTIHDSYGCLVSDMDKLYSLLRETFLELYQSNPLESIIKDIGADMNDVDVGTLDLNLILESEYCFS